ncbi:MAG: hypothetical protein HYX94_09365 [Chloroflexi bacterium]|nr:hypothetical protein [Chloroflexota bacterium]
MQNREDAQSITGRPADHGDSASVRAKRPWRRPIVEVIRVDETLVSAPLGGSDMESTS